MDAFVGEIRAFGFNFAPPNWLSCDGSLQSISNYEALFNLIGTTYGGDGVSTFGLPDLRGRVPAGASPTSAVGTSTGQESVTLTAQQVASHTHPLNAASSANTANPSGSTALGPTTPTGGLEGYGYVPPSGATTGAMAAQSIGPAGGSSAHENRQPLMTLNFIICTSGPYPQPA